MELFDIEEIPEGTFPQSFKLIERYHQEEPTLTEILTRAEYKKGSFCGGWNTIELITYKNKYYLNKNSNDTL